MKVHVVDVPCPYDGRPLHGLWAYRTFKVQGDSLVVFRGPCDVSPEQMVDLEDLTAGAKIAGPDMLHFIAEHFDRDLEKAVLRQRLLASLAHVELLERTNRPLRREGDDIYDGDRKLSISIATLSPVSAKIHFAINIVRAEGVGVPTGALGDYGIEPFGFGRAVAARYVSELSSIEDARTRVRGVP